MFILNNTHLSVESKYALLEKMRAEPIRYLLPTKSQAELYRAIGQGVPQGVKIFLNCSGNGAGKTLGIHNLIANIVWPGLNIWRNIRDLETGELYSGFFDYDLFKKWPNSWPKEIWYVSNKDNLKSIWEEWKRWVPEKWYTVHKEGLVTIPAARVNYSMTDFVTYMKTTDQDIEAFRSANVCLIIFDEPPMVGQYDEAIKRLRKGGFCVMPATPLQSATWFLDRIIEKIGVDNDKFHMKVSAWSNCIETAGLWDLGEPWGIHPKGNLLRSDVEFTLRNTDPDLRPAAEFGEFAFFQGIVFKGYGLNREKIFLPIERKPKDPEWYRYAFVVDPHDRRPPFFQWYRIDEDSNYELLMEWPSVMRPEYKFKPYEEINDAHPYVIKDFVKFAIEIEKSLKIPKDRIVSIMDPNMGKQTKGDKGETVAQMYSKAFKKQGRPRGFITTVDNDIMTGVNAVKDLFVPDIYGKVKLRISTECVNTDHALRNWAYEPEPTGKATEKRNISVKYREIGKDPCDGIRYFAMIKPRWTEPTYGRKRQNSGDGYDYENTPADDRPTARCV